MINRLGCPYSEVHLNNKPHISGKEKNRDCKCANIGKDPEMKILKIQNSEKTQKKPENYWVKLKSHSLEDRLENGMIKSLLRASSRAKITISGAIAIPSGKSSQLKPHTGTESYTFSSITILTNSTLNHNGNAALEGTIKPLIRPQNSKNVNKLQRSKIQSHTGNEAPTIPTPGKTNTGRGTIPPSRISVNSTNFSSRAGNTTSHSFADGYTTVHRRRNSDTYSDVLTQSQTSIDGSSITSTAGGSNSASSNE
jgi:hypothetical protein